MTGWAPGPDGPEDAPLGPVPHPDDRLWRHPSEVWASLVSPQAQPPGPGHPLRRAGASVLAGLLIGAAVTTAAMAAAGAFRSAPARSTGGSGQPGGPTVPLPPTTAVAVRTEPTASAGIGPTLAAGASRARAAVVSVEAEGPGRRVRGAGVFIRPDGALVTTYDLVDGAETVWVTPAGGQRQPASLVGSDLVTDVAVLRIAARNPAVMPGPSPRSGQVVTALVPPGSGPGDDMEMGEVTTTGLNTAVSGSRILLGAVASDVPLPPGAEGAPVLDTDGRLVGMVARPGGSEGPTLCLPAPLLSETATQILTTGSADHGYLGVDGATPGGAGLLVTALAASGPARDAGMRAGDVLVSADGTALRSWPDLLAAVMLRHPGDTLTVTVERAQRRWVERIRLGSRDDESNRSAALP